MIRRAMDFAQIVNRLSEAGINARDSLELLREVDSTNAYLMRETGSIHRRVCIAERQHAGRGRAGREWHATNFGSILLSIGWEFERAAIPMGASLAAGVAVIRALQQFEIASIGLKWPNDLVGGGRKLGGILVEVQPRIGTYGRAVVGVGLNVHVDRNEAMRIDQPWIDLVELGHGAIDRSSLAAEIIQQLFLILEQFADSGLGALREEWTRYHAHQDQQIVVSTPRETLRGKALGIDERGALLLEDAAFRIHAILVGDVSLRKEP